MKRLRLLATLLVLPLVLTAAERTLKVDRTRSYVEVDVDATINFTAHLDAYELRGTIDDKNKIKTATFTFRFADLRSGKTDRDADMIKWLGGGDPTGKFELGLLALTPDGQGQVSGNLTFHDATSLVEFPVNVIFADGTYTITGEATLDYRIWKLKKIRKLGMFTVNPFVVVRFKFVGMPGDVIPPPAK